MVAVCDGRVRKLLGLFVDGIHDRLFFVVVVVVAVGFRSVPGYVEGVLRGHREGALDGAGRRFHDAVPPSRNGGEALGIVVKLFGACGRFLIVLQSWPPCVCFSQGRSDKRSCGHSERCRVWP